MFFFQCHTHELGQMQWTSNVKLLEDVEALVGHSTKIPV